MKTSPSVFAVSANDSQSSIGRNPIPLSAPSHRFASAIRVAKIIPKTPNASLHKLATQRFFREVKDAIGGPKRVA